MLGQIAPMDSALAGDHHLNHWAWNHINGGIALDKPLLLPDGSKVIVRIEAAPEPAENLTAVPGQTLQETFPFFGQWADRMDPTDSAE